MEVERHLPVMMAAALLIERCLGECHFVIPAPTDAVEKQINAILAGIRSPCHAGVGHIAQGRATPSSASRTTDIQPAVNACGAARRGRRRPTHADVARAMCPTPCRISVVRADSRVALRDADAAIVKSGTSTLEAALMGCPQVIVYQMAKLSGWVARQVIQVPFVGLPNIVAGRRICRELLLQDFTPENVADEIVRLLQDNAARDQMKRDMAEVTAKLGGGGASACAARAVMDFL